VAWHAQSGAMASITQRATKQMQNIKALMQPQQAAWLRPCKEKDDEQA
jgi:hypothetical protein